jgi:hypothetical protein
LKRDLKKILGLAGAFATLYTGLANFYPVLTGPKMSGLLVAVAAGVSAYVDTQKKPPKNPKLPS